MSNRIYRYEAHLTPTFPGTTTDEMILDLGLIEGYRYVSASESITFSEVFEAISFDGEDGQTRRARINAQSPTCQQIDEETQRLIRARYSLSDELKALRTQDEEYQNFIETTVAQGKAKKARLGL